MRSPISYPKMIHHYDLSSSSIRSIIIVNSIHRHHGSSQVRRWLRHSIPPSLTTANNLRSVIIINPITSCSFHVSIESRKGLRWKVQHLRHRAVFSLPPNLHDGFGKANGHLCHPFTLKKKKKKVEVWLGITLSLKIKVRHDEVWNELDSFYWLITI